MVRVAIDARLLAYQSAGTATYIRGLISGFQGSKSVDVLALRSRKDGDPDGLANLPMQSVWTPCHHRWERWAFGLELAGLNVDVVHSPDFIAPARLVRRWARVVTVHDLAFLRFPEFLTPNSLQYYQQIHRSVAEAERIISVSEATRRDLLELTTALPTKIVVVPEGVNPAFRPISEDEAAKQVLRRFGIARPYFLFVGTLEPRKNLGSLLEAFRRFRATCNAVEPLLVLAGSRGWLTEDLDRPIGQLGDSVRLLGRVSDEDLVPLYNAALALALVSHYEGFGLPPLEAMACGRPTLVSNVASLPEVVGEAGIIVAPDDVDAMSDALRELWQDSTLRQELGRRALRRASSFNWRIVARKTEQVYLEAAACAC